MSASMHHMSLDLELPWSVDRRQEDFFQRLLKRVMAVLLVVFLIVPWLPVFEAEYVEPEDKLVKTTVILDPPEYEKPKPIVPPKPKPRKPAPAPRSKPKQAPAGATSSLAALSSQLSALRKSVDVKRMQNKNVSVNETGKVRNSSRSVLGKDSAVRSSGGIEVDQAVMSDQAAQLASHQTATINSPVGVGGSGPVSARGYRSNIEGRRDMESIRRTFELEKGGVYALYTSALRKHPELSGKFLFELVIEPDGSISNLKLINSELGMQSLEREILARINRINFGAADVNTTVVQYKFVFLPS